MNVKMIIGNKEQRKVVLLLFLVCLLVVVIAGGYAIAFMVAPTQAKLNNANVGDINTKLTETTWDALADKEKILYPGKTVPKNPVVVNTSEGDHGVYAYIKVRIPRAEVLLVTNKTTISNPSITDLFSFQYDVDNWIEIQSLTPTFDNTYSEAVYGYNKELEKAEQTPPLFETIMFANILEGSLKKDTALEVEIESMAIQADYLDSVDGEQVQELIKRAYSTYLKQ